MFTPKTGFGRWNYCRRIGSGKIAALFGKDFIAVDQLFLALGIDDASKKTVLLYLKTRLWSSFPKLI